MNYSTSTVLLVDIPRLLPRVLLFLCTSKQIVLKLQPYVVLSLTSFLSHFWLGKFCSEIEKLNLSEMTCRQGVIAVAKM